MILVKKTITVKVEGKDLSDFELEAITVDVEEAIEAGFEAVQERVKDALLKTHVDRLTFEIKD